MAISTSKEVTYQWEGKNKKGNLVKGEMKAKGEAFVSAVLRREGFSNITVKKQSGFKRPQKITEKDITLLTRQLAVMLKAGVPLLQSFDIIGKGHSNSSVTRLLAEIKSEVETGSSLSQL